MPRDSGHVWGKIAVVWPWIEEVVRLNMRLKLARVEMGLSQQELADKAGVTRQTIGLIEKGRYNPTLNLCVRIARALNRTLDQLFWEANPD